MFPENSEIEYKKQVELILKKLGLTDLLRAEMRNIDENFEPFCNKSFHQPADNLNVVPFDIVSQLLNKNPTQNYSNRVCEDASKNKKKLDASILDEDTGLASSNNGFSTNKIRRIEMNNSTSSQLASQLNFQALKNYSETYFDVEDEDLEIDV